MIFHPDKICTINKKIRSDSERQIRRLKKIGKVEFNFAQNINDKKKLITVNIELDDGIIEINANKKRIYSSTTYIFILWMISASIILFIVALLFLKNQIKPIRK